ncbi:BMC domain-containing protein [Aneurinibacillus terranovensis]|uniref:BMC domain-containing protein n=1 Tax=Aneurinibacillus terranovensis TaxID=278991 RepID=UPI00068774D0|nr:BMC domain-containing protein [Aneurinibacillus terranovensis]
MPKALGMIETRGLVGSIEAADAMIKAADVRLVKQEKVDGAIVTVLVEGDVSAVYAAIEAGKEAAAKVGELLASHVIPHPDKEIQGILQKEEKKNMGIKNMPKTEEEKDKYSIEEKLSKPKRRNEPPIEKKGEEPPSTKNDEHQ